MPVIHSIFLLRKLKMENTEVKSKLLLISIIFVYRNKTMTKDLKYKNPRVITLKGPNYPHFCFLGLVILKKSLDYERVSSYNIDIEAADRAANGEDRLAARSSIIVEVSW